MRELKPIEPGKELALARAALAPSGKVVGDRMAVMLVGGFSDIKVQNADVFLEHLARLLAEFPEDVCEKAVKEIPRSTPKYKFGIDTVSEFLEAEMTERRLRLKEAEDAAKEEQEERRRAAEMERIVADQLEFKAWLKDNPGGSLFDYLGIERPGGVAADQVDQAAEGWE